MLPLKSSLPRTRITRTGVVIASVPVLLAMYWLFHNPDAAFRSSDANWARHEISFKALEFDSIAFSFEAYRYKCQAESAQLVRTTKVRWWNVFALHSYMTNPKWKVPYGEPDQRTGSFYPRGMTHCANEGFTPGEREFLSERSAALVRYYADGV